MHDDSTPASTDAAASELKLFVYGAYGHTGRFVVAELARLGLPAIASGRDPVKLETLARRYGDLETRAAVLDDPDDIDRALIGASLIINCAGPFASTAAPLIDAALRAGLPYIDVAAEIEANEDTFTRYTAPARSAGVTIVPAMAFYGGLGDLLATAAMGDWPDADEIHIAYGLTGWHPTAGTRAAGAVSRQRRDGQHVSFHEGSLRYGPDTSTVTSWSFPEPLGIRKVRTEFSMADIVTIPRHLDVPNIYSYMTVEAVDELSATDTPSPVPTDETGRSAQLFVVDVVARRGGEERHAIATGQDIYAITGPLAVEAAVRILNKRTANDGVGSAGTIFDAVDFLNALAPHFSWHCEPTARQQVSR